MNTSKNIADCRFTVRPPFSWAVTCLSNMEPSGLTTVTVMGALEFQQRFVPKDPQIRFV